MLLRNGAVPKHSNSAISGPKTCIEPPAIQSRSELMDPKSLMVAAGELGWYWWFAIAIVTAFGMAFCHMALCPRRRRGRSSPENGGDASKALYLPVSRYDEDEEQAREVRSRGEPPIHSNGLQATRISFHGPDNLSWRQGCDPAADSQALLTTGMASDSFSQGQAMPQLHQMHQTQQMQQMQQMQHLQHLHQMQQMQHMQMPPMQLSPPY
eukprot:TRINITY_DN14473_c0_g1_i3.p1 TRINITY_DN14473_c0_g1~~TRINITY_DN14473_c0_g1_i3.p1  ORF type:complete len:210 (-),score=38.87 TRINITY_DN14473_c0_g1_i3:102-731(-)